MHFEIYAIYFPDVPTKYRWRLRAKNGEIIAQGEEYTTKRACMEAIELVENSHSAPIEDMT